MTNSNYTLTIIYNNLYTYFNYKKLYDYENNNKKLSKIQIKSYLFIILYKK